MKTVNSAGLKLIHRENKAKTAKFKASCGQIHSEETILAFCPFYFVIVCQKNQEKAKNQNNKREDFTFSSAIFLT